MPGLLPRPLGGEKGQRYDVDDSLANLRRLPSSVPGGVDELLLVLFALQVLEADHGVVVEHALGEVLPAFVLHLDVEDKPDVAASLQGHPGQKIGGLPGAAHKGLEVFHLLV